MHVRLRASRSSPGNIRLRILQDWFQGSLYIGGFDPASGAKPRYTSMVALDQSRENRQAIVESDCLLCSYYENLAET
ncbi:hypothetical protein GC174_15205 [bacterium]|nr:hypothetical protein [bacterium]